MKITSIIPIEVQFGADKFCAFIRPVVRADLDRQRADAVAAAEVQVQILELQEQLKAGNEDAVKTIADLRAKARAKVHYDIVADKLVSIGPDDLSTGIEGEFEVAPQLKEDGSFTAPRTLNLSKKADALEWAKTDMRAVNALTQAISESQRLKTGN